MGKVFKRMVSLISAISLIAAQAVPAISAGWITVEDDLRSPLTAERADIDVSNVGVKVKNVCYDLQSEYPTSLYKLSAEGKQHDALCVAAKRTTPGDGGTVYKLDLSGLKSCQGDSTRIKEASANLTATEENYSVWWNAYRYSDLANYNDEQILRKIAWLVDDGNWTYYPLAKAYAADDLYSGIELDYDHPANDSKIYRDLVISTDAQARYKGFDIASSRVGAKISGLYGAAHAIASRIISGDRYHLSGTIYYSFTRTESDKATYTRDGHSTFAYGDDGNGNDNNKYRRIQLMQYFNIIAHAPEYKGNLYIYSPDKKSGSGQQWLLFVDRSSDYKDKEAYVKPVIDKDSADGNAMNGAEFTLYEDAECKTVTGVLTDKEGTGKCSSYKSSAGDKDLLELNNNNDGTFTKTVYLKETKAPSSVTSDSGNKAVLTESIVDKNVYKVDLDYNMDSKQLSVKVSSSGKAVYEKKYKDYDALTSPAEVKLANSKDGDFKDGLGLVLLKESDSGFTVTNTAFELYRGSNIDASPIAYYRYDGEWKWYEDAGYSREAGRCYPVAPSAEYTVVERFTGDCYKDTDIRFDVVNNSGWIKVGDNAYKYTFTTPDDAHGQKMTVKAVNDRVTSSVKIIKTSDDGNVSGVRFDLYYLGNKDTRDTGEGVLIDSVKTDRKGAASISGLPLGWYRIREVSSDDYVISWKEGTVTDGGDAIVRLTDDQSAPVTVEADNRLMVKVAVIKKDAQDKTYVGGAAFRLYKEGYAEDFIEASDDDGDGITVFDKVGTGTYVIEEVRSPAGYYLNKEKVALEINGRTDNTVTIMGNVIRAYQIEFEDKPYSAPLAIDKVDANDHDIRLGGAMFEIYEDTDNSGKFEKDKDSRAQAYYEGKYHDVRFAYKDGRYEAVIDADGEKTAYLRYGTYFIVEAAPPEMYKLSEGFVKAVIPKVSSPVEGKEETVTAVIENEPGFGTVLAGIGGSKVPEYGEKTILVDTVAYTNLIAGKTYNVRGALMLVDSDGSVTETGITSHKEFTVEDDGSGIPIGDGTVRVSGKVHVQFEVDTTRYTGKTLVAYEVLYSGDELIARHEDPEDRSQSISVPELKTELTDKETGSHTVSYGKEVTVTDKVSYSNLIPGHRYVITGVLTDKETGKELTDAEGNIITASREFEAEDSVGDISLEFTLDSTLLAGKMIVAFETLRYEGRDVAVHADINDEDQTAGVPELVTRATGSGDRKIIETEKEAEITDVVEYKNLTPGRTYMVAGSLMYASTGSPFHDPSGNLVTSQVTFVPDTPDGSVSVRFRFNASELKEGDRIVVYEDAYEVLAEGNRAIPVCGHRDPDNRAQTVTVSDIPKTGTEGTDRDVLTALIASFGIMVAVPGLLWAMRKRLYD